MRVAGLMKSCPSDVLPVCLIVLNVCSEVQQRRRTTLSEWGYNNTFLEKSEMIFIIMSLLIISPTWQSFSNERRWG